MRNIETEIRKALDAKAHEVDVPATLRARTFEIARTQDARGSLGSRVRSWRDGRVSRARVGGYPRILYAGAAAASALVLFGLGTLAIEQGGDTVVQPPVPMDVSSAGPESGGGAGVTMDAPAPAPDIEADEAERSAEDGAAPAQKDADGAGAIAPAPPLPATGNLPPKIVRTANVDVEVASFDRAWNAANGLAARLGGFVTNSSTETVGTRLGRGSLVMRVPAEKLETAIAELRKLGSPKSVSTSADDISAPVADVKARLKALEAQELQLLELMGRANTLSETLEVRSQLDGVRQEIESYEAQRDGYEDQVRYSTVNATIFERGVDPSEPDGGDGILADAVGTAVRVGLTILAGSLVVLGGLVPIAALGLVGWLLVRTITRRRRSA